MVEDNLKDFTINWAIFGLLFTCLIGFSITFMANNNSQYGLNDGSESMFSNTYTGLNSSLYEIEINGNEILNTTSQTDPERSELGSRDSVGTSYSGYGTAKSFWADAKSMISYIFTGDIGKILITTISGLIIFLGAYYIYKSVRTGT